MTALAVFARHGERFGCRLERALRLAVGQIALGEVDEPGGEIRANPQLAAHRDTVLQETQAFVHVTHADEREAQQGQRDRQPHGQVLLPARFETTLER